MKKNRLIFSVVVLVIIALSNTCVVQAMGDYKGVSNIASGSIFEKAGGYVFNIVATVGSGIAVISLTILGIKYMVSSVEDRAEIKKKLIPFTIGAGLFFGSAMVIQIILQMVSWLN